MISTLCEKNSQIERDYPSLLRLFKERCHGSVPAFVECIDLAMLMREIEYGRGFWVIAGDSAESQFAEAPPRHTERRRVIPITALTGKPMITPSSSQLLPFWLLTPTENLTPYSDNCRPKLDPGGV